MNVPALRHLSAAVVVSASVGMALPCFAQTQAPMLKNNQVTEDALVDALSVETPATVSRTRGFGPSPASRASTKPAGPGKANLMVTFRTGSAELTPESMKALDTVAKALQSESLSGLAFKVEGHADPRGTIEGNLSLSEQRAQAVVAYLVSKGGILTDRLSPVGKGSAELYNTEQPDAPENRRVTIVTVR